MVYTMATLCCEDFKVAKHERTQYPEIFTPVVITCVIIGVVGNMCFCFFFGNNKTRIYRTRDALYFRRMSILDMLVCVIVLPYLLFYELWFVHNRAVCKIMSFIQHMIMYTSHLTLAAYSFELARRVSYADVQVNVDRIMKCNVVLAVIFSLPTLFLFDVDEVIDDQDKRTRTICKLCVSFQHEAEEYGTMSLLRIHYYSVMCLCYTVALVLFIFKIMHYCERLAAPGRRSVNVQLTERTQLRQLKTLKNSNTWRHKIRRHSQTGKPIIFAEYSARAFDDAHAEPGLETNNESQEDVSPTFPGQSSSGEDTNIPYNSSITQENAQEISAPLAESSADLIVAYQRQRTDSIPLSVLRLKNDPGSTLSLQFTNSSSRENSLTSRTSSSSRKLKVFVLRVSGRVSTSRLGRIFTWPFSKQETKKSILKQKSSIGYLKIRSYKQQIISLILLDFIFILTGIALYLMMDEHGVAIHLIHTKCIISFYWISIAHPDLRQAVQNHIIYYCLRPFQPEGKVHHCCSKAC